MRGCQSREFETGVSGPSYLYDENPINGKTVFLFSRPGCHAYNMYHVAGVYNDTATSNRPLYMYVFCNKMMDYGDIPTQTCPALFKYSVDTSQ